MATSSQKDLAIVIVSWNVKDVVLANLRSVFLSSPMPSLDVILVDNASQDGTVEAVKAAFPEVQVIANTENLGFAKACNQGLALSSARHKLLLNPDMRVEPDAFANTISYLDAHPEVAVLGARLVGEDGKVMHHMRRFPTVLDQTLIALKLKKLFPRVMNRYMGTDLDAEQEQRADSVRGAYFAISQIALEKIGVLDERYYIWFEEVDYCKRVQKAGMKVMYVPSVHAHDLVGKSFAQRDVRWKQTQFRNSMIKYFDRWHAGIGAWTIRIAWALVWPYILFKTRKPIV